MPPQDSELPWPGLPPFHLQEQGWNLSNFVPCETSVGGVTHTEWHTVSGRTYKSSPMGTWPARCVLTNLLSYWTKCHHTDWNIGQNTFLCMCIYPKVYSTQNKKRRITNPMYMLPLLHHSCISSNSPWSHQLSQESSSALSVLPICLSVEHDGCWVTLLLPYASIFMALIFCLIWGCGRSKQSSAWVIN